MGPHPKPITNSCVVSVYCFRKVAVGAHTDGQQRHLITDTKSLRNTTQDGRIERDNETGEGNDQCAVPLVGDAPFLGVALVTCNEGNELVLLVCMGQRLDEARQGFCRVLSHVGLVGEGAVGEIDWVFHSV